MHQSIPAAPYPKANSESVFKLSPFATGRIWFILYGIIIEMRVFRNMKRLVKLKLRTRNKPCVIKRFVLEYIYTFHMKTQF